MAAFHRQRMLHKTPQALVRQRRTPGSFQKTPGTTPSGYDMDDSFMTQSAHLLLTSKSMWQCAAVLGNHHTIILMRGLPSWQMMHMCRLVQDELS